MTEIVVLVAGVVLAAVGGELFVRGTVGLAEWLRVSPGLAAATIAAFATSSPELAVSVTASADGRSDLALGDALGSNIVNIAVVLALALLLRPIQPDRVALRRNLPFALGAPALTAVLLVDGVLTRWDALVLLVVFGGWLGVTVRHARGERSAAEQVLGEHRVGWALVSAASGTALLITAGRLIVSSAEVLGTRAGLDPFVIGATVVALGTSTPEVATVLIAARRHHAEIGVGTVLGSNLFNGLLIVPVAVVIQPARVPFDEVALGLAAGLGAAALLIPGRTGRYGRRRASLLLAGYSAYLTAIVALGV